MAQNVLNQGTQQSCVTNDDCVMSIQTRGNKEAFKSLSHTPLPTLECGKQKKKNSIGTQVCQSMYQWGL